ncbi:MAG: nuclear transport factor 2 family protein [Pseudomonadota bacterium]
MTDMPESFQAMLDAWNETDPDKIRRHLDRALDPQVEFADPNYHIRGIAAFEAMVRGFRTQFPDGTAKHTSGMNYHHNRYRYSWLVSIGGKPAVHGMDVTEVNDAGKVVRIDGFFGDLPAAI